jgi:hypothetical protein
LGSQGSYLHTPILFALYIKPAIHFKWIEWNRLYQSFQVAYIYI